MGQSVKHALTLYAKNRKRKSGKSKAEADLILKTELDSLLSQWKDDNPQKQEKKQKKDEEENNEHAPNNGELTAVLWRNSSYSRNCTKYLRKIKERGDILRFETEPRKARAKARFGTEPLLEKHIKQYALDKRPENFDKNGKRNGKYAGQKYPYAWQAHHMIPCSAFYDGILVGSEPQKIFDDNQQMLLLMSDYNVNFGRNMIPLPEKRVDMQVHDMVFHFGSHPSYTKSVQTQMKKVAKKLNKITKKLKQPHPKISVKIAEEMANFEDQLWDQLCELGIATVDVVNAGQEIEHDYLSENGSLT